MKAVSYLKLTEENSTTGTTTYKGMSNYLKRQGWEGSVEKFYNQKFEQEMITRYFDEWIYEWNNVFTYNNNEPSQEDIVVFFELKKYKLRNSKNNSSWQSHFMPQTLDNFISDCESEGIELYWVKNIEMQQGSSII